MPVNSLDSSRLRILLTVLLACALAGCQSTPKEDASGWKFSDMFDIEKGMPWHKDDEEGEVGIPTRLVDAWTDSVLHKQGQVSQRGFGGRIHFYNGDSKEPIRVDGTLVVYTFDETNREPTDNKPTKRYVFPPEQLKLHESESKLGPSYSVWLPWGDVNGPQTEVSLICRFEPRNGTLVVGHQNRQRLAGTMVAEKSAAPPQPTEGVQQAMHVGTVANHQELAVQQKKTAPNVEGALPDSAKMMSTTTIKLPYRGGR